ncbi:MAG: hypothetical protein U0X93_13415 [Anaerolineales bacterium]
MKRPSRGLVVFDLGGGLWLKYWEVMFRSFSKKEKVPPLFVGVELFVTSNHRKATKE